MAAIIAKAAPIAELGRLQYNAGLRHRTSHIESKTGELALCLMKGSGGWSEGPVWPSQGAYQKNIV